MCLRFEHILARSALCPLLNHICADILLFVNLLIIYLESYSKSGRIILVDLVEGSDLLIR